MVFVDYDSTFDGHRFLRRRDQGQGHRKGQQYHLSSTSADHLGFGHGPHSCPGRFFAANEIKLILARILLGYDLALPAGVAAPYPDLSIGVVNATDTTKEILLRRVAQ